MVNSLQAWAWHIGLSLEKRTVFSLLLLLGGCSGNMMPADRQPVFPVTGKLTYQGIPMKGAVITFHEPSQRKTAQGVADDQGAYWLTTYLTGDGAAAGDYVVTIHWPDEKFKAPANDPDPALAPDVLRNVYTSAKTSTLKATVQQQPTTIDFPLK